VTYKDDYNKLYRTAIRHLSKKISFDLLDQRLLPKKLFILPLVTADEAAHEN